MKDYRVKIAFTALDEQGYDPHVWYEEESCDTFDEALYLAVHDMSYCDDPLTTAEFEIFRRGESVLRVGPLVTVEMADARKRVQGRGKPPAILVDLPAIDDDDLPF